MIDFYLKMRYNRLKEDHKVEGDAKWEVLH